MKKRVDSTPQLRIITSFADDVDRTKMARSPNRSLTPNNPDTSATATPATLAYQFLAA
ncbi:hypothetical protein OUQ91_000457 [Loigolactobacillus backii]|nr:hypothetical protein [Loigolactobacillus backii]